MRFRRDVVLGDDVLGRDVEGDRPQVDLHELVDDRDLPDEPGATRRVEQPAEAKEDRPLILPEDPDKAEDVGSLSLSPHRQLEPVDRLDLTRAMGAWASVPE